MSVTNDDQIIAELYRSASKYLCDYIYTLLRVGGAEYHAKDPILLLTEKISKGNATRQDIDTSQELWTLIANLCRLQREVHHMPFPFKPDTTDFKQETFQLYATGPVGERLKEVVAKDDPKEEIEFIGKLLDYYQDAIREFTQLERRLFTMSGRNFEVFEVLVNEDGLYGFNVYFSNDSSASFKRTATGVDGKNIAPENAVGFMVGNIDENKKAWRVEGKWLYEVGLLGRYNEPGEWKPLVYPSEADLIQNEALDSSNDERVQGALFYMLATGHPAIEFVAKSEIKLPDSEIKLPGDINLLHIEQSPQGMMHIYDGWVELRDRSVKGIKAAIEDIQRAMESIAFSFDKEVRWRLKYNLHDHSRGASVAVEKDMQFLDDVITNSAKEKELALDAAINWYNIGNLTQNPLNAFLCFHIAIEGLAVKLAQGELRASSHFGLSKMKETKSERKKRIKSVFDGYYATYYAGGKIERMIRETYDIGVVSIRSNLEKGLKAVFGDGHQVLDDYFKKDEGIWDMRGSLVHEVYSDWHPDEYAKVQTKLPELREIAKAFITRVAFQIDPDKKRPQWSRRFELTQVMSDPRHTLVASPDLRMLPQNDWKIRPEWVD